MTDWISFTRRWAAFSLSSHGRRALLARVSLRGLPSDLGGAALPATRPRGVAGAEAGVGAVPGRAACGLCLRPGVDGLEPGGVRGGVPSGVACGVPKGEIAGGVGTRTPSGGVPGGVGGGVGTRNGVAGGVPGGVACLAPRAETTADLTAPSIDLAISIPGPIPTEAVGGRKPPCTSGKRRIPARGSGRAGGSHAKPDPEPVTRGPSERASGLGGGRGSVARVWRRAAGHRVEGVDGPALAERGETWGTGANAGAEEETAITPVPPKSTRNTTPPPLPSWYHVFISLSVWELALAAAPPPAGCLACSENLSTRPRGLWG
mmetsp:Transcript_49118/g.157351  ORF Transcript_49118/g.157351 Transcript_49118/m.157351 type:complete len:319 (+) Transcript_49118:70-1026(+)